MQNYDILSNIRKIVNREQYDSKIIEVLKRKCCRSLLSLTEYSLSDSFQLSLKLNEIAIGERIATLKPILEDLELNLYAMIKGFVLSYQIYNDVRMRMSGDVDIIIESSYMDEVKRIMKKHGFIQGTVKNNTIVPYTRKAKVFQITQTHQMAPFIKTIDSKICPHVQVDINLDLVGQRNQIDNKTQYILNNTEDIIINSISIRKLSPEIEFVALCCHHYKDLNSVYLLYRRGINLNHFCDVYFYVKNNDMQLNKLYKHAVVLQVLPCVYYCLYYTYEIFKDEELQRIMQIMYTKEGELLVSQYGLNHVYQWENDFVTRLFSETFQTDLYNKLTDDDKRSIDINDKYM